MPELTEGIIMYELISLSSVIELTLATIFFRTILPPSCTTTDHGTETGGYPARGQDSSILFLERCPKNVMIP
jgi:hypothetical protein